MKDNSIKKAIIGISISLLVVIVGVSSAALVSYTKTEKAKLDARQDIARMRMIASVSALQGIAQEQSKKTDSVQAAQENIPATTSSSPETDVKPVAAGTRMVSAQEGVEDIPTLEIKFADSIVTPNTPASASVAVENTDAISDIPVQDAEFTEVVDDTVFAMMEQAEDEFISEPVAEVVPEVVEVIPEPVAYIDPEIAETADVVEEWTPEAAVYEEPVIDDYSTMPLEDEDMSYEYDAEPVEEIEILPDAPADIIVPAEDETVLPEVLPDNTEIQETAETFDTSVMIEVPEDLQNEVASYLPDDIVIPEVVPAAEPAEVAAVVEPIEQTEEIIPTETETATDVATQQTEEDASSPASTTATGLRQQLVDFAASRVGVTPYVWAGRSLETGTDCSGFVNLIYDNFGYYASPGSDDYQDVEGDWGENIGYNELQPGDVVVYRNGEHVGIYAGQDGSGTDIIIHDSNEIDGVKVSDMNYSTPTAFVRIIDDGDELAYEEDEEALDNEELVSDEELDEYDDLEYSE